MKLFVFLGLFAFGVFPQVLLADQWPDPKTVNQVPPIEYVKGMVWHRLDLADFTLNGVVRSDKTKTSFPIQLLTKGHQLVYSFTDQSLQIRVHLDAGNFSVEKRASASAAWAPVKADQMSQAILGTDITYGDLALNFLNWDDLQPLGIDSIKTLKAYVFQAKPGPDDKSAFAFVRFWVSSQYWAFLRIDGLNSQEKTVKRVEVQDVMQIGKFTVFKEMKVSHMDPQRNDIATSTTFIDIKDGKEGSGLTGK